MKFFYSFFLCLIVYVSAYSQDSTKKYIVTRTVSTVHRVKLDTNEIVYDEQGNGLHYYQYQKMVNTGQYTIWSKGLPGSADGKRYLKKLSIQDQNSMYEQMKERMAIKSPFLKENTKLDISPLTAIISAEQLENKVVVLIFWNAECPPCTESFSGINEFLKQIHNPEDVVILAITTNTKQDATAKLKEKPLLYAQLISNAGAIDNAYQLHTLPSYVVADKAHVIRFATSGSSSVSLVAFKNAIQSVLLQ